VSIRAVLVAQIFFKPMVEAVGFLIYITDILKTIFFRFFHLALHLKNLNFDVFIFFFTFCEVSLILQCQLKTHIIKINSIKDFTFLHPDGLRSFNEWVIKVKVVDCLSLAILKKRCPRQICWTETVLGLFLIKPVINTDLL
jgi:hypothetical protein